jgi:hypothetical protein
VTRAALILGWVAAAVAFGALRPASTPGPPLRDFEAYWAAGSAWNAHLDPYERGIWRFERTTGGVDARRDELLPFIGPPATLPAWSVLARFSYARSVWLWETGLAACLIGLVLVVMRGSGKCVTPSLLGAMLLLALAFGPITSDLALGQTALVAFCAAASATLLADTSLPAAGVATCFAFAQPNAALGLASQLGRNRITLALAIAIVVTFAVGALARGWSWPIDYARALAAHGAAERFVAIQFTPLSLAYGFGAVPRVAAVAAAVVAALAIAAAIALAVRVPERFARFSGFSTLVPFVAGFFHEHDFVLAYAAAGWCAIRTGGTTRAMALIGTLFVAIDWLGLAQRPTGIVQSSLLAVAALAAFLALGEPRELFAMLRAAVVPAVCFAAAAWLARHHPVPIWPDALGQFRAAAAVPIATVWAQEQRAAGLLHPSPVWSLLRTLPLLGCALLAAAIYRHSSYCRTA